MTSSPPERKTKGVEAVDKALRILGLFSDATPSLNLTDISRRSGYVMSTAMRLLTSLQQARLVTLTADKQYRIGAEALRLGTLYQRNFRLESVIRPALYDLVQVTGESASFFRREGDMRICLFREDSAQILREHVAEGEAVSLDRGAAGHILTAHSATDSAVTASDAVLQTLPRMSTGERGPDITGIAAPVFATGQGLVGAITLSGPGTRFTPEKVVEYRRMVFDTAARLSADLGSRFYGEP
ncbi:IclR family transcriptional regulator [Pseudomonas sp. XS1P51]